MTMKNILLRLHTLCQYLPHLILIASLVTLVILSLMNRFDYLLRSLIVLLPLMIASIILIKNKEIIKNKPKLLCEDAYLNINISSANLIKIYFIVLSTVIGCFVFTQSRNWLFLILIVVLYCVIIFQIFAKNAQKSSIILFEIITTTTIVIITKFLSYDYYYWTTDLHIFSKYSSIILISGNIPPETITGMYGAFPLYTIFMTIISLFTNLIPLDAIHLAGPISILVISIIIVYYLTSYFSKSERISAIAALCYSLTPIVITYATHAVPRTFSTIAFLIVLYLFLCKKDLAKYAMWVIGGLCILYMTIVHHAQLMLIIPIMTIIILTYLLYRGRVSTGQKGLLILFYFIPLVYWIYNFLYRSIKIIEGKFIFQIDSGAALDFVESSNTGSNAYFFNIFASSVLVIFVIFGLYFMFSPKNIKYKIGFLCIPTLILFALFIPGILDISTFLADELQIERMRSVISPIFAVVMGIGCVVMINTINTHITNKNIGVWIAIVLCIFLVIASPIMIQTRDTEFFSNSTLFDERYFDNTELSLFQSISTYYSPGTPMITDYYVERYFPDDEHYSKYNMKYFSFEPLMQDLFLETNMQLSESYIIFRQNRYFSSVLPVATRTYNTRADLIHDDTQYQTFLRNTFEMSIIQENGYVKVYHTD